MDPNTTTRDTLPLSGWPTHSRCMYLLRGAATFQAVDPRLCGQPAEAQWFLLKSAISARDVLGSACCGNTVTKNRLNAVVCFSPIGGFDGPGTGHAPARLGRMDAATTVTAAVRTFSAMRARFRCAA